MDAKNHGAERALVCLALVAMLSGGCVFGPRPHTSYEANSQVLSLNQLVVFQDSTGALSYQTPAGRDVRIKLAPRVKAKACQHGIQVPFAWRSDRGGSLSAGWGQGAYREAMSAARKGLPKDAVLFDVRADLNKFAILTVYQRRCLLVDAAVAVPIANPGAPPAPVPAPVTPAATPEPSPPVTPAASPEPPAAPTETPATLSVPPAPPAAPVAPAGTP